MKTYNKYFTIVTALTLVAFTVASCELFKGDEEIVPETTLELDMRAYTINSSGDTINIKVTSNAEFDYEILDDAYRWISEKATLDADVLRFEIKPNEEYDERSGEIRIFTADGKKEEVVKVRQMQKGAIIVAEHSYEVDCAAQQLSFTYNTNIKCKVRSSASWLTESATRGLEQKELCFDIAENDTTTAREAQITISGGDLEQTVTVYQAAAPDRIRLVVEHADTTFYTPWWTGTDVSGSVVWDDGNSDSEPWYEGIKHDYKSMTEAVRRVVFDMENVTELTIGQIGNIMSITIYANDK